MPAAVLSALGATALWGLAFVAPQLVATTGSELAFGRYLVYGLSSLLLLGLRGFRDLRGFTGRDWLRIVGLGLLGSSLYYVLTSAAILAAGPIPVVLVFAPLPLVMASIGNLRRRTFTWRSVAAPFALIAAGLAVNVAVAVGGSDAGLGPRPVAGLVLALLALVSWLVYALWNSEYLTERPLTSSVSWASLTGLGTLLTLPPLMVLDAVLRGGVALPGRAQWPGLVLWSVILGVGASWLATWLWARASLRVGAAVLGFLVVGETVFAVLYACLVDGRMPSGAESLVIALVLGGVAWGLAVITARAPRGRHWSGGRATG